MQHTSPSTITIEDKNYRLEDFSTAVRHMVEIHTIWKNELAKQNLEVAKTQAALKSLESELAVLAKKEADAFSDDE